MIWVLIFVVSIHASVKDATGKGRIVLRGKAVSIHASVKDATEVAMAYTSYAMFQSTHL